MQIGHICTPNVITCPPETTIFAAAKMMKKNHVGTLVVVEEINGMHMPQGIITDRDIVVIVLAEGLDPKSIKVADIMKTELMTALATEDIFETIERMRYKGIRRIPVVDKHGALAGVVSVDDIWKYLARGVAALSEVTTRQQNRERTHRGR